ncbi:Hypothetical predicted protein, partial [Paramuricea clavata]
YKIKSILKPEYASICVDDGTQIGEGKTPEEGCSNLIDTVTLFTQLGLLVHPKKCNFIPSQEIVIWGFIINSVKMTVKLTPEKALALKSDCDLFLKKCPERDKTSALARNK